MKSPELKDVRSLVGQVGTLVEGENALYVRPSKGDIPEITLVTTPKAGTDGVATVDKMLKDAGLGVEPEQAEIAGARRTASSSATPASRSTTRTSTASSS